MTQIIKMHLKQREQFPFSTLKIQIGRI